LTPDQREVENITPAFKDLSYEWEHVRLVDEAKDALISFQPNLVILNALLPSANMADLCALIRDECGAKILVTSPIASTTHLLQARHKWGADEVVALPVPLKKMVRLVAFMLGDIDQRPNIRGVTDNQTQSRMPAIAEKKTVRTTTTKLPLLGDLRKVPLGRVLSTIISKQLSGILELGENEQQREMVLLNGRILELRSGYLENRGLGDILVVRKNLNSAQLDALVAEARQNGIRLGELLRSKQLVGPNELFLALDRQVIEKLSDAFDWEGGRYEFRKGLFDSNIIEPRNLLLAKAAFEAARRASKPEEFEESFSRWMDQRVFLNSASPVRMNLLDLSNDEKRFLVNLKNPRSVRTILHESNLSAPDSRAILTAMIRLRMVTRRG
jgi:Domain of unknown function (DUF4388)